MPASRPALAVLALLALPAALAAETRTVTGEVVAVQCYLKDAKHRGETHVACALSCAKKGATLGVLAEDGLYVITGEYTKEVNRRLVPFVAKVVEATGEVAEHEGRKTIEAKSMKLGIRD